MIFFGTRSSTLKEGTINNEICSNCEKQTSFNYAIFQEYFHVYWIPTFPTSKTSVAECVNCKKTFYIHELSKSFYDKFQFEKQGLGFGVKFFSGTIAVICIVLGIVFFSMKNSQENDEFVAAPMVGDIYSYETEEGYGHYSTFKIAEVTSDSLYFYHNDYETNEKSGISSIDVFRNYSLEQYVLARKEIDSMYKRGKIFEIDRDE